MEGPQGRLSETHAYILAVIPPKLHLRPSHTRGETVLQAIGESYFTLLELAPAPAAKIHSQERVSIEKNATSKIEYVKRRLVYEDLTPESVAELPLVVEIIVTKHERRFVQFFNEAQPMTTRMHSLQLLPGIGQTLMWAILEERKKEPFKSFDDISTRIKLQNPKKAITARIITELSEDTKRWLFVRPPSRNDEQPRR
jgi:putative nucleotide binding protein